MGVKFCTSHSAKKAWGKRSLLLLFAPSGVRSRLLKGTGEIELTRNSV
jgi:hypothetical protein